MRLELWILLTLIVLSPFYIWLEYYWAGLLLKVAKKETKNEKK